jgi:murein DD-endopeptidase MepM/ murein hydrolase activator NlpD
LFAPLLAATAVLWLILAVGAIRRPHDEAGAASADHAQPVSGDIEGTPSKADIARARRPLSVRKRLLEAHPDFALYKAAKRAFGVSWYLVAAVHYQETGFGKAPAAVAKSASWRRYRNAERGLARPASYPNETSAHPSVHDSFDVVTAIGAQLKAAGARALGPAAEHALVLRYGTSPAGRQEAAMVYERARAWQLLGTLPLPGRGELATPVKGVVNGCGYFGCPRPGHLHNGVDFTAPAGTPIHAADEGHVALVQTPAESAGYGNFVCIQHRPHLATCYAHMSAVAKGIAVGTVVRRGQVIGLVGTTGDSSGPHLHFEVRRGPADCSTCAVDPLPLLSGDVPASSVPAMSEPAPAAPPPAPAAIPPATAVRSLAAAPRPAATSEGGSGSLPSRIAPGERSSLRTRNPSGASSGDRAGDPPRSPSTTGSPPTSAVTPVPAGSGAPDAAAVAPQPAPAPATADTASADAPADQIDPAASPPA